MRLAVIGAGNVGSAIARAGKQGGHDVVVTSPTEGEVEGLASALGAEAAASNSDAVTGADFVVLAVPWGAIDTVTSEIADQVDGTVVIDATNPIKDDSSGLATEGTSGAEVVQQKLPGARVVKAFNTVFASNQDKGEVDGVQLDGFVAGDDDSAKSEVVSLLEGIGFRPIDVGPLQMARYLEAMAFLNISLNANNGWSWQSAWKLVGPVS